MIKPALWGASVVICESRVWTQTMEICVYHLLQNLLLGHSLHSLSLTPPFTYKYGILAFNLDNIEEFTSNNTANWFYRTLAWSCLIARGLSRAVMLGADTDYCSRVHDHRCRQSGDWSVPACQHVAYQELKTRVISRANCLALAEIWQVFRGCNPHIQLCFSSHKCVLLTNVTSFKQAFQQYKIYCQEATNSWTKEYLTKYTFSYFWDIISKLFHTSAG